MEAMLGDILTRIEEKKKKSVRSWICSICKQEMEDANWKKHFHTVCPGKSKIIYQLDRTSGFI